MTYPQVHKKAESRVGTCLQGDGVPSSTAWQTLGAGLTGSVILPTTSTAQSMPEALPKTKSTVSRDAVRSLLLTRQWSLKQPLENPRLRGSSIRITSHSDLRMNVSRELLGNHRRKGKWIDYPASFRVSRTCGLRKLIDISA
jgi:hypothetical protein